MYNFDKATRELFTAKESSMGSSGGTTDVIIRIQWSKSLDWDRSSSFEPSVQTYHEAITANTRRKRMNKRDSKLFAVILSVLLFI
jgi:hypothetical protein